MLFVYELYARTLHDIITLYLYIVFNIISSYFTILSRWNGADLLEAEEDEVSSSLPERPRTHRKASSKLVH